MLETIKTKDKKNVVRRLYDWVLHWAETPYGALALIILAFAESSFFPIPPDVLLIVLVLGARQKAFKYALYCSLASVAGGIFGYGIGHFLWWNLDGTSFTGIANFFFANIPGFTTELFYNIKAAYDKWDFWIVFTAGFTPIPYKVFTVSSGAFQMNIFMFIIASVVGRSARFFLVAYLLWKYGANIKSFIDKYFNLLAMLFTVLLIGGFVLIKYLI